MWITCEEVTTGVAREQRYECVTSCPPRHDQLCELIQSFHEEQEEQERERIQRIASHGVGSGPQTSAEGQYPHCEGYPTSQFKQISLSTDDGYEDDTSYTQYDPPDSDYTHEQSWEQEPEFPVPAGHTPDAKKDPWSRPRGIPESFRQPSASYSGQEAADSPQTQEFDSSYSYGAAEEAPGGPWSPATEYRGYGQDVGPQQRYSMGETGLASPPESVRSSTKESKSHHRSSKSTKLPHSTKGVYDPREPSKRGSKKEKRKE